MYLLTIFPFLKGINELHVTFIFDIVLLCLLIYKINKNKMFVFTKDIKFVFILLWSFSYLLTTFWSIDTEFALLGFLKFFTVPIFLILLMQYKFTSEQKDKWFDGIAKIGAIMVIIILLVSLFDKIVTGEFNIFFHKNRLSGFFGYANSFALFLLIGIIITGFKENIKLVDFLVMNLLLVGIILTNSRGVMVFTAIAYLLILVFNSKSRKKNFINLGVMAVIGLTAVFVMDKGFGIINRLSSISIYSGEWILRVLYYKDAFTVICSNVFGHGYMAWWYMQKGFQTGVYDTQFVHNGLLQVALDAGVIAALLIVVTFVIGFFDKKVKAIDRVLMLIILGHSLMDFNMEFLAITLVLFMTLEFSNKFEIRKLTLIKTSAICLCGIYIFFGIVETANEFGQYEFSNKLFPTSVALSKEIEQTRDFAKMVKKAEVLYEKNKYFLNASTVLSQKEQMVGNFDNAYEHELWIIQNRKYKDDSYIKYVAFLEKVIKYYYAMQDYDNMNLYINRLFEVENMINETRENSDKLAYKIYMPEKIKTYIEQMKIFAEEL